MASQHASMLDLLYSCFIDQQEESEKVLGLTPRNLPNR